MRVLAGGPTREDQSELFRLHVGGLEAQDSRYDRPSFSGSTDVIATARARQAAPEYLVDVRHEVVSVENGSAERWPHRKVEAVARCRQKFLRMAWHHRRRIMGDAHEIGDYDALFMVDSDVICGPGVLERMWAVDADVVYGVFWTIWPGYSEMLPQVWNRHPYGYTSDKLAELVAPGVNEVEVLGGGACTLFRGRAFESRYFPLLEGLKVDHWAGEDRSYCVGLECRDIKQVAVTGLPIVHLYNKDQQTPEALAEAREMVGL